jgi:DNA-binding NarL/FixJ family response regulator
VEEFAQQAGIAASTLRAYLTTSTVEQHLTRIYRKLGVGSRVQLLSRLGPQSALPHSIHDEGSA